MLHTKRMEQNADCHLLNLCSNKHYVHVVSFVLEESELLLEGSEGRFHTSRLKFVNKSPNLLFVLANFFHYLSARNLRRRVRYNSVVETWKPIFVGMIRILELLRYNVYKENCWE